MRFGITLKPDHRFERSVDLAKRAEANGFTYGWIFDSTSCGASRTPC